MSVVTAIKQQVKNPERVSVFVDGKYSFSLTLDQLLEQTLKKGQELDETRIKRLKKLSDEGKLKARTMEWLMGRPHSVREFRDYLFRKKAEPELIDVWVDEFLEKKYLNDQAFAEWFAEARRRKNKSSRAIVSELMSKGIAHELARTAAVRLETDDQQALKSLVAKMRRRPRYQDEKKLIAYLLSKGFAYDQVKEAVRPSP